MNPMKTIEQLRFEAQVNLWLFDQFGWLPENEEFVW